MIKLISAIFIILSFQAHKVIAEDEDKPVLATASIIHMCPENRIALIERSIDPKGIALLGGGVKERESPEQSIRRKLKDELNITTLDSLQLVGVNGEFGRDPRKHAVEITYMCTTSQVPQTFSNEKNIMLYTMDEIKTLLQDKSKQFAFDHAQILAKYLKTIARCNPCKETCKVTD